MINNLQDIVRERRWDGEFTDIAAAIEKRLCRQMELASNGASAKGIRFTRLQHTAFNHPDFFRSEESGRFLGKNLIVQGATSAGKTLVSEIAVLDALWHKKKVLILVPLKSMVRERFTRFRDDFSAVSDFRVYASSSDYLDYDEDLLYGKFDVAVMVYEKLFAMLCQPNCKILDDCGLIVVDELSMLEVEARGPKLEIALEKAKSAANPARILCLATTDCDPRYIGKWLSVSVPDENGDLEKINAQVICETSRPVGLNEYVVKKDGSYRMRTVPGENETLSPQETVQGKFPVAAAQRDEEQRRNMLTAVLNHLYAAPSPVKPKTLVFVPSQNGVRRIAEFIAGKLNLPLEDELPRDAAARAAEIARRKAIHSSFQERLQFCDTDDDLNLLQDSLLKQGVAFHHGSMSTNLRELLEEQFAQDPSLKIIVATETLTIGVNLPIDAVILYDTHVPDGSGRDSRRSLTMQQYRNYIGRAGRLGLAQRRGESYLLALDPRDAAYWEDHDARLEPITSALVNLPEDKLAPYYLNLLLRGKNSVFTASDIKNIHESSLSRICGSKKIDQNRMISLMEQIELVRSSDSGDDAAGNFAAPIFGGSMPVFDEEQYILNQYGKSLAPYAFSLGTAYALINCFIRGLQPFNPRSQRPYGFTGSIQASDITGDRYLMDILFTICMNYELVQSSPLNLSESTDPQRNLEIRKQLRRELLRLVDPPAEDAKEPRYHCELWQGSYLKQLFCGETATPDMYNYNPLFRALLMFYWVKGHSAREIRRITGIDCGKYSNGDLERCADAISFQLDAAYQLVSFHKKLNNSIGENDAADSLINAVLNLSKRVKYGVPSELIIFANRHVHGLDRSRIIAFGKAAEKAGKKPLDYLRSSTDDELRDFFTPQQRSILLQRLRSRFSGDFELLTKKLDELAVLQSWKTDLNRLHGFNEDADGFFRLLGSLLSKNVLEGKGIFRSCRDLEPVEDARGFDCADSRRWVFDSRDGSSRCIYLTYCRLPEKDDRSSTPIELTLPGDVNDGTLNLVLLNGSTGWSSADAENVIIHGCGSLFLNCDNLAVLLASSILLGNEEDSPTKSCVDLLYEILNDARGHFSRLAYSWLNYDTPHDVPDADYQLLMDLDSDTRAADLKKLLEHSSPELKNFRILPWGSALETGARTDVPTVVLLNRNTITHHHSLMIFLNRMKQDNLFRNCLVLVKNDADVDNWTASDCSTDGMPWIDADGQCTVRWTGSAESCRDEIRLFLEQRRNADYLIGLSYPHYDEMGNVLPITDAAFASQNTAFCSLATQLNRLFGEDLILWDQNARASGLFHGEQSTSLEKYAKCKLGVILYNQLSQDNHWCKNERRVMRENGIPLVCVGSRYLNQQDADSFTLDRLPTSQEECRVLAERIRSRLMDILSQNEEK
ncbi:MAG: DEAD/DEAH box helicase [Oscillospiraceae bacterium]|nr:DEAD/DEAH box helicase [Oscillospiraceae bacterium]